MLHYVACNIGIFYGYRSQPLSDDIILAKLQLSEQCQPDVTNRQQLVTFMVLSRKACREWIIKDRPSITSILGLSTTHGHK